MVRSKGKGHKRDLIPLSERVCCWLDMNTKAQTAGDNPS